MKQKSAIKLIFLLLLLAFFFVLNISFGAVKIPFQEVVKSLLGGISSKETWQYIIVNYRLPKAITTVLVGVGLSVSGLLMQTLFRNPMAGPFVLGLTSGSSLGVALIIMGATFLPAGFAFLVTSAFGVVLASCLGSFLVLLLILIVAQKLRDTNTILVVGLMFSSFVSAFVSVLTYFSTAEQLQKFTFWSMGSLGNLSWNAILLLSISVFVGLLLGVYKLKSLDALLLGENYAASLGINFKKSRLVLILATSILAGSITAFAGPIAFVGLAVPHLAKLVFNTSQHQILFVATAFFGAIIMLVCDVLCHIPGTETILPINAITSIVGAPVVIWLLMRQFKPKSNF
jgi:iron complex transport system permease protein